MIIPMILFFSIVQALKNGLHQYVSSCLFIHSIHNIRRKFKNKIIEFSARHIQFFPNALLLILLACHAQTSPGLINVQNIFKRLRHPFIPLRTPSEPRSGHFLLKITSGSSMAEKTLLSKKLVLFGVLRQQKGKHALVTMLETTQSASFLGTKKLFIPKKYLAHFV